MDFPPPKCLEADLALACSKEVDNWISPAVVFRQPFFANYSTETGSKACREASEPETVDRDDEPDGSKGAVGSDMLARAGSRPFNSW